MTTTQRPNYQATPLNTAQLRPGYQRDGGYLASAGGWIDGQHMRFYNGRPQKMEGLKDYSAGNFTTTEEILGMAETSQGLTGPNLYVFTDSSVFLLDTFEGAATTATPTGWGTGDERTRHCVIFKESTTTPWLIFKKYDGVNNFTIYYNTGGSTSTSTGISSNGGLVALHPYTIIYDEDGQVQWSVPDDPTDFSGTGAGSDYITDEGFIWALPYRDDSILLWTERTLWQMKFVGGTNVFEVTRLATGFDVIDAESIVQYNGRYYWIGSNNFYMFDGRVRTLPNTQNANWFFKNNNANTGAILYSRTTDIVGIPNLAWGEIWWSFKTGGETLASKVLIFDVKTFEQTGQAVWWDTTMEFYAAANLRTNSAAHQTSIAFATSLDSGTTNRIAYFSNTTDDDVRSGTAAELEFDITTGPYNTVLDGEDRRLYLKRLEFDFEEAPSDFGVTLIGRETAQDTSNTDTTNDDMLGTTEQLDYEFSARYLQLKFGSSSQGQTGETFKLGNVLVHLEQSDST